MAREDVILRAGCRRLRYSGKGKVKFERAMRPTRERKRIPAGADRSFRSPALGLQARGSSTHSDARVDE
jgi:hypothetical protein